MCQVKRHMFSDGLFNGLNKVWLYSSRSRLLFVTKV